MWVLGGENEYHLLEPLKGGGVAQLDPVIVDRQLVLLSRPPEKRDQMKNGCGSVLPAGPLAVGSSVVPVEESLLALAPGSP